VDLNCVKPAGLSRASLAHYCHCIVRPGQGKRRRDEAFFRKMSKQRLANRGENTDRWMLLDHSLLSRRGRSSVEQRSVMIRNPVVGNTLESLGRL
jgi:hypothetical protein